MNDFWPGKAVACPFDLGVSENGRAFDWPLRMRDGYVIFEV